MRVDIIIPVYNEKENFRRTYEELQDCVHADWRVLLVYDMPEDSTLEVAAPIAKADPRLRLVRNSGRGVLRAITSGFDAAEADAVLVLMVDDPPQIIERIDDLVRAFYEEHATIAVASRYMRGGSHTGGPFIKGLLSRTAGISLHFLIGLPTHDATYATRMYRREFLHRVHIESIKGFELSLELTLKAYFAGEKIIEIPVHWVERVVGESRFQLKKWLGAYLRWYWYGISHYYVSNFWKNSRNAPKT
jgi:dolichol-phosphate mannosyltransferase